MRISDWSSDVCSSDLNAIQVSNAVIKTAPARQNLSRRNIISLIKAVSALSKRKPYQGSAADENAIPGEGRESIAGDDREERLDDDPGDDEGNERPDADQAEVAAGDGIAVLEELQRGRAAQRRQRQEKAELGRGLAVDAQRHPAHARRARTAARSAQQP